MRGAAAFVAAALLPSVGLAAQDSGNRRASLATTARQSAAIQIAAESGAAGAPLSLDLAELERKRATLVGRLVSTSGRLAIMGVMGLLATGDMDSDALFVELSGLPPEAQQRLRSCGPRGCRVTVSGRIADFGRYGVGLKVDELVGP